MRINVRSESYSFKQNMKFSPLTCEYGNIHIQQRYVLCFMTFLAIVNCYNTRMCLHIAITEIAKPSKIDKVSYSRSCPDYSQNYTNVKVQGGTYNWTEMQQGVILLSFFPGYLIFHLPGGILADRYGGRHVLSLGVLISALVTIVTPAIIQHLSWHWLVMSRFIIGSAQASMYPSITALLAHWVPARQRSRLGSLVYSGIQVGIVTGILFSGLMIQYFANWHVIFYVWGVICLIWYGCFLVMCFSKPDTHPFITQKEKDMLDKEFGVVQRFRIPWKAMLKDSSVWALIIAQFGHDWITYLVEVDMPKYFKSVLKMNIAHNAIAISIPFIAMWVCSNITGYLSDYIIYKHNVKIVTMRIIFTTIASVGPSTFLLIATYMGCNITLTIAFFWIGMISMGPYCPGLKVNVLDLTINFSGILMSIANGIGVLAGIIVPYLVAKIAKDQAQDEWQQIFWVSFFMCMVTNITFIIWSSGDRRKWDRFPEVISSEEYEQQ